MWPVRPLALASGSGPAKSLAAGGGSVESSVYTIAPPLIKRSPGGGFWAINFAVGCLHACPFCYADYFNKAYPRRGLENLVQLEWGSYFAVPRNIGEAIDRTPWHKWRGKEVFMSSMHDPYLPQIAWVARRILKRALPSGVRLRILTRSTLVLRDLGLMSMYPHRVTLGVSIATLEPGLYRVIEPRAPPPAKRIQVLREAAGRGIATWASVAPIFPPNPLRPDPYSDLVEIARALALAGVREVYGESLHERGDNLRLIARRLGASISLRGWDRLAEKMFYKAMDEYGLKSYWYPDKRRPGDG